MENQAADMHFYASSVFTWATTSDRRDLRALLKLMDKEKIGYNLWMVPVPFNAGYEIKMFAPQVEGAKWVGFFEPGKSAKAKKGA